MAAPRLLPDNDVLVKLREQGWTYDDIASEYGVTRSAVYLRLRNAQATSKRATNKDLIPWTVKVEHAQAHPAMMLRLLGRRLRGDKIPDQRKERMLDKWLREIKEADVVVCYDPNREPNPASPVTGGWYYSRRRPSDGDSIIRETDEALTH